MKRFFILLTVAASMLLSCKSDFDPATVEDAGGRIERVEPMNWWVGMKTPLQLLIKGEGISQFSDVTIEGGAGVKVTSVVPGDSKNYLFVDVAIAANAEAGTYYLVFSDGNTSFKKEYVLENRKTGSAERKGFTSADAIYLITPDRFANGDPSNDTVESADEAACRSELFGRHGGDIQGIIDHLDYIADLGMTAIWTNPMFLDNEPHASYHGYACADYYLTDPRYGTNELFREYVEKAHEKGLKVIVDLVTNHCGTAHWWMKDLPFEDWIHVWDTYTKSNCSFATQNDLYASSADRMSEEAGWFDTSMPDMNLDNPYMLNYFIQCAIWWIEWSGLDGYRLDTYPYNEKVPMSKFNQAIYDEYPDFNIVGEVWTASNPQLAYWLGGAKNYDGFDSHLKSAFDFPLFETMNTVIGEDYVSWSEGMVRIYDCIALDYLYPNPQSLINFVGNHDTERLADRVGDDPAKAKIFTALMATVRGGIQYYSGDETMQLNVDLANHGDGGKRVDFPGGWEGDAQNFFTEEGRAAARYNTTGKLEPEGFFTDIFNFNRKLFQWRKTSDAVHNGRTMHFITRDNTYAYFRYTDSEKVFVYINNSLEEKVIPWASYSEIASDVKSGREIITDSDIDFTSEVVVSPKSVMIIECN